MIKVIEKWSHHYSDATLKEKVVKFLGITLYKKQRIVCVPSMNGKPQE